MDKLEELNLRLSKLQKYDNVSILTPSDGNFCFCKVGDIEEIIQTIVIYIDTSLGGSYRVRIYLAQALPASLLNRIESQTFQDPMKAYKFAIRVSKKINNFFRSL